MYYCLYILNGIFNFYFADDEIDSAIQKGNLDILKVFLANRENKNPVIYSDQFLGIDFTVLHRAAWFNHANIVRWFQGGKYLLFLSSRSVK